MVIEKKETRDSSIATKLTASEKEKLSELAKASGVSKSNLVYQMIKNGYKSITGEDF